MGASGKASNIPRGIIEIKMAWFSDRAGYYRNQALIAKAGNSLTEYWQLISKAEAFETCASELAKAIQLHDNAKARRDAIKAKKKPAPS